MRVQVNISDEMVDRVDEYAKKMGVSRSSLCSMLIGQGIMSYDKSFDMVNALSDKLGEGLIRELELRKNV